MSRWQPLKARPTTEYIRSLGRDDDKLADAYNWDPPLVAAICDEELDRSGALLGRVRLIAKELRATPREGGESR